MKRLSREVIVVKGERGEDIGALDLTVDELEPEDQPSSERELARAREEKLKPKNRRKRTAGSRGGGRG